MNSADKRAVIVICDGHRDDLVQPELCPNICQMMQEGRRFANHRGIYPSVTRASVCSFATGCWPSTHGLHGNTMALDLAALDLGALDLAAPDRGPDPSEYGRHGLTVCDAGRPEIFEQMQAALGRSLRVPTMAARIAQATGSGESAFVISNGSPGAARFHDPDHKTYVYHRAGCFGPGGAVIENDPQLTLGKDASADRIATIRFCEELESGRNWRLAVLWLCEPDTTMHATILGSDTHKQAIAGADQCVATVAAAVSRLRDAGHDILFMAGSDHGQETVADAVPLEQLLVDAGLKDSAESGEVVVAPQGSAAHIYVIDAVADRVRKIETFCRDHAWCGALMSGMALEPAGQTPELGLRLSISMRKYAEPNIHGLPGVTDTITSTWKPAKPKGYGMHGGLGKYEAGPFLIATGGGMQPESTEHGITSLVDIAPTVLNHLGIDRSIMDGRPLPVG